MIPTARSGVKTDIVERFTISEKGQVVVTTIICNRFDAIARTRLSAPGG